MATSLNFRSAIGGFHREDVVHYIEYMNSQHRNQLNQLQSELEQLQQELSKLKAMPDLSTELAALRAQLDEAHSRHAQLEDEKAQLAIERDEALATAETLRKEQSQAAARELAAMELEAYRRAEQAERKAQARAEQIYQQATGTLAQATSQVDDAAISFRKIAEQVGIQMTQLQQAVDSSKNALLDAATTMYSICPNATQE